MRLALGTRVGSPAAVKSPRTGSAMIWAACLPIAQPSVPDSDPPRPSVPDAPRPSAPIGCAAVAVAGLAVGATAGAEAGPDEPLPAAASSDVRLRNQSDVAAVAGAVSRAPVTAGSGTTTSRRWLAGWASANGRAAWMSVNGRVGWASANERVGWASANGRASWAFANERVGWASANERTGAPWPPVIPRPWKPC